MSAEPDPCPVDPWQHAGAPDALAGRTVMINGATGALGGALARACASHGATVVLLGRDVPALESLYDAIVALDAPEPAIVTLDLASADADAYAGVTSALSGGLERLDGLVHAAATLGQLSPLEHAPAAHWHSAITVNLSATFQLTQACMPLLRSADDASVVFTLDHKRRAYWAGYGVAKAGVEALAGIMAHEWEPPAGETRNVRVNAVDPGPFRSRLRRAAYPAENAGRLADAAARIAPYLYFLSNASAGVNGVRCSYGNASRSLLSSPGDAA